MKLTKKILLTLSSLVIAAPIAATISMHDFNNQYISKNNSLYNQNNEIHNNDFSTFSLDTKAVNKVMNLENFYELSNTIYNSVEFKELIISNQNDPSDWILKLSVNQNNNLEIIFNKKVPDSLQYGKPDINSNKWTNVNIFRVQKVAGNFNNDTGIYDNPTLTDIINSNDLTSPIFFDQSTHCFNTNEQNLRIEIQLNNNEMLLTQLYCCPKEINNYLKTIKYSMSIKCINNGQETIINSLSDNTQKKLVNFSQSSTSNGIEGYLAKINNKWVWSYSSETASKSTYFSGLLLNQDVIDPQYLNLKASEAINTINDNEWKKISAKLVINNPNAAFVYNSKVSFTSDDSRGILQARVSFPCSNEINYDQNTKIFHFKNLANKKNSLSGELNGFKCGSQLLKTNIDAKIDKLPEFVLSNNELLNNIYTSIYEQGFGPDNLLPSFNPLTDIKLDNIQFNNIEGTINCSLIIKNNYVSDVNGEQITNNTPKDFGNITIHNFKKIKSTQLNNTNVSLSNNELDNQLKTLTSFEASKPENLPKVKQFIFNNINTILSNVPQVVDTGIEFTLNNIVDLNNENIDQTQPGILILKNIKITNYYNSTNGSYNNVEPFLINKLTINNFKTINPTVINEKNYSYSTNSTDIQTIYPEIYLNNPNSENEIKNFIFENTNKNQNIIQYTPSNFNVNDITIKSLSPINKDGTIRVDLSITKWIDNQQNEVSGNNFPIKTIYLTGFEQAKITSINPGPFLIQNYNNILPSDFILKSDALAIIKDFIFQNSFQNLNIISGSKPTNNFNQSNINVVIIDHNNKLGTITIKVSVNTYINNHYQIKINQDEASSLKQTITIKGFSYVSESKLLNNSFYSLDFSQIPASSFSEIDITNFLIEKQKNNELLSPVPSSFDPNTCITINNIVRDNKNGIITFNILFKNFYNANGNVENLPTDFGKIQLTGFLKTSQTILKQQTFDISNDINLAKYKPNQITNQQALECLVNFQTNNQLLSPVPIEFNPMNDIHIINLVPDINNGTLTIQWEAKNIYDNQSNLITTYTPFANVTLTGFLSTKPTNVINQYIKINQDDFYSKQYSGNINQNDVFNLFNRYKTQIFSNLPADFNIRANLIIQNIYNGNNLSLNENQKNFLKYYNIVVVQFKLNYFVDQNGDLQNGIESNLFTTTFYNFKPYPIQTINNQPIIYNLGNNQIANLLEYKNLNSNEININLNVVGNNKYLKTSTIINNLNQLTNTRDKINLITNGDSNIGIEPLIKFSVSDNSLKSELRINQLKSIKVINDYSMIISCTLGGNYYFLNNTPITIQNNITYNFKINGFGAEDKKNTEKYVVIIAATTASGAAFIAIIVALILFFNRDKIFKRKKDIYDDKDNNPISIY